MLRNILFIVLFLLVYGAIFLLGTNKPESTLTDRTGNGLFAVSDDGGAVYTTDRYGLEMTFAPDWIVFDGVQLEKRYRDSYPEEGLDGIVYLGGFQTPQASLYVMVEENYALPSELFSSQNLQEFVDGERDSVIYSGGSWGSGTGYLFPAQGNGERIALYYYDYRYLGEYDAIFWAALNVNGNAVYLDGYYTDLDGLATLTDFVKNGLRVTASGNSAV